MGTKYFEKVDVDANHAYTRKIRNWFVSTFNTTTNEQSPHKKPKVVSEIKSEIGLNVIVNSSPSSQPLVSTVSSTPKAAAPVNIVTREKKGVRLANYPSIFRSHSNAKAEADIAIAPSITPSESPSSKAKKK